MEIIVKKDYEELSKATAKFVADYIKANPGKLLCFAAGDTPLGMLGELVKMQNTGEINLASMWYVGLDEWIGLGYEDEGSCKQVMFDNFYYAAGIPSDRIFTFDGRGSDLEEQCRRADEWISIKGGIGLVVLGVGMNGHLGFNEPGVKLDGKCMTLDLASTTLNVGKKYFKGENCPTKGITVGLGHILKSGSIVLMASGEKKATIIRQSLEGEITNYNPASLLQNKSNFFCFLDSGAASMLKRVK